jgi:hypothetical protein
MRLWRNLFGRREYVEILRSKDVIRNTTASVANPAQSQLWPLYGQDGKWWSVVLYEPCRHGDIALHMTVCYEKTRDVTKEYNNRYICVPAIYYSAMTER